MKRKLAWLILLSMLLSFTASMEELKLPDGVTRIEEEAFMGDRSVTSVKLNDHVQAIGPRAFWNCEALQEIYIPDSVTQIGEEAFYKNAMITCGLESYAYDYARQNGYRVNVVGNYVIHKVWMDGDDIQATVSTTCACTLQVEMLDEEKTQTLYTASTALPRNAQQKQVSFQKTNAPDSFVLRASLLDKNGYNITYPYESMDYTSAYKTFENRTPEDFPEEQVLNYGSAGFGVLDDSVINVTGSREGNRYRIISDVALHVGDALYIQNLNELVKIGTVSKNADGSYAVTPEEKADLTDCYQYLRYSDTIDAVNALAENGTIPRSAVLTPRGSFGKKLFTSSFKKGPVTADCTLEISVHCDLKMDRILSPDGYIDVETYGMVSGGINYTLSGKATSETSIPVFDGYILAPVPGVFVNLNVSIPIKFESEGSVVFDTSFEMKGGVKYSTQSGVSPLKEGNLSSTLSTQAKITGSAGTRLGIDLMYMNVLSIGTGATVGASIEAKTAQKIEIGEKPEDVEKKHACALCFDVDIDSFIDLDANIALKMLFKRETVSKTWPAVRTPIFKGYLSLINDKDSVHGGKIVFNQGECPNYKYRTKYQAFNEDGKERAKYITINRVDPQTMDMVQVDTGISKYYAYLYPGTYEAETYFDGYYNPEWVNGETVKERFVIVDAPKDVELRRGPKPTSTPTPTPKVKPTKTPRPESSGYPVLEPVYVEGRIPVTAAYFPDAGFRAWVKDHVEWEDYYNESTDQWEKDGYLSEDERLALTRIVDCYSAYSLEGVEYFPNITSIDFYYDGNLTNLCLAGFDCLQSIYIWKQPLKHIDVKGCTAIEQMTIKETEIKTLDVSGIDNLEALWCENNPNLLSLYAKNCRKLGFISYSDPVETLNLSGCTSLQSVGGYGPNSSASTLNSLDVSGCTSLTSVYYHSNPMLSSLNLDGCINLESLYLHGCGLETLRLTGLAKLENLDACDNDYLKKIIDMSDCTSLKRLVAHNCQLENLDLEKCTSLEELKCYSNQLTSLDVSHCVALQELICSSNRLEELDVRRCTALKEINCGYNYIRTLDVSDKKALEELYCQDNQLTDLNITGCDKLWKVDCSQNALSQLDASSCPLMDNIICDFPDRVIW